MSSTIPSRVLLPLLLALALPGCQRGDSAEQPTPTPSAAQAANRAPSPRTVNAAPAAASNTAGDELSGVVLEREDIEVNGEPACALTVRYSPDNEQPVTWNGERCSDLTMELMTLAELAAIRQDAKLDEEARDSLARMQGRQALYIEGSYSSALYPENVMGRIYEVPLAD